MYCLWVLWQNSLLLIKTSFYFTRGFNKLQSAAHTNTVWSATAARVIGITPRKTWKYFSWLIALCMWMRTAAILLVFVHAFVERIFPFAKGGLLNVAVFNVTRSLILNALSAIKSSWGSNLSRKPDFWVMFWSDISPVHSLETNVKAPDGEMPANSLKLLWVL